MKVAVYGKQYQEEVAPFVLELFQELGRNLASASAAYFNN